jgi:hypothetical protein
VGAERAGVRWGNPENVQIPTSPSHAFGVGPSLSPQRGRGYKPGLIPGGA